MHIFRISTFLLQLFVLLASLCRQMAGFCFKFITNVIFHIYYRPYLRRSHSISSNPSSFQSVLVEERKNGTVWWSWYVRWGI